MNSERSQRRHVLFLFGGTPHYYNHVLNRLHDSVDVTVATPSARSITIGDAVYETTEGIRFAHRKLNEARTSKGLFLKGLGELVDELKPTIIVTVKPYLSQCFHDRRVCEAIRTHSIRIILKDHPFRLPTYAGRCAEIENPGELNSTHPVTKLIRALRPIPFSRSIDKVIKQLRQHRRRARLAEFTSLLNQVDGIVCYVDDAFRIFGSYGVAEERIFITRNSPDTDLLFKVKDEIETEVVKRPRRLIHVGRLVPWKRVDLLIRAFAKIVVDFDDAELRVVGFGPEQKNLEQLAEQHGLGGKVSFPGGIYDPEVLGRELMQSGVYVLAGMGGLSINDAMTFGLPIVCSVCDGTEKHLVFDNDNGFYFEDDDEEDLVAVLTKALSDPVKLQAMGQRSIEIIRNEVNIDTVISGYLDAFKFANEMGKPDIGRT